MDFTPFLMDVKRVEQTLIDERIKVLEKFIETILTEREKKLLLKFFNKEQNININDIERKIAKIMKVCRTNISDHLKAMAL